MSKVNPAVKELLNLREQRNALAKQIKNNAKKLFKEAVHTLFEEHPILVQFAWTQYTPYFNDGDTCEFGSNHYSPSIWFKDQILEGDEDDDLYSNEFYEHKYYDGYGKDKKLRNLTDQEKAELKAGKAVVEFLGNFKDDDMLAMFGDHQMITVTAKKVEAEEYSHE